MRPPRVCVEERGDSTGRIPEDEPIGSGLGDELANRRGAELRDGDEARVGEGLVAFAMHPHHVTGG